MNVKIDMAGLEQILKARLGKDQGKAAAAGIFADKANRSDGRSNLGMALAHEFGSPEHEIPERSHMQAAFKNNRKKYIQMIKDNFHLNEIAKEMSLDIIEKIATGPFAHLQPEYVKQKARRTDLAPGARTLIATGEYIDAIDGRVVDSSRKGG